MSDGDELDGGFVAHWRLHNLRLAGDLLASPIDVVRWLGAVQSQDFGPAKWSVGMRSTGASDADLDRIFAEGGILRTHLLRPTWHFVLPEDIRWMLDLTAPRVQIANGHPYRRLELDEPTLTRCNDLIANELAGGNHRTRKQIGALLQAGGISTEGQRLPYILMNAELCGLICSGAPSGRQQTYALLDERAPGARRLSREEALAELTWRYVVSHGPVTARDFQAWSSLTLAEIREGLSLVASTLERGTLNGMDMEVWFVPPVPDLAPASPVAHLLQGYDEYFMGYRESRGVVDHSGYTASLPEGRSVYNGVVILDSQIVGHWKRTLRRRDVVTYVALYRPLDDAEAGALMAAADRHGAFLGLSSSVVATLL